MAISLRVRPLLETGVLLILTEPLGLRRPVLAVGLVQGEVRGGWWKCGGVGRGERGVGWKCRGVGRGERGGSVVKV